MNADPDLASRWKRLAGSLIDTFIMMGVLIPALSATGLLQQVSEKKDLSVEQIVVLTLFTWSVYVTLHGYLLLHHGQTIGKRITGTRIVGMDGVIPPFYNILVLRYFLIGLIGCIPIAGMAIQILDCFFVFNPDRRCIHDLLAGTRVVNVQTKQE